MFSIFLAATLVFAAKPIELPKGPNTTFCYSELQREFATVSAIGIWTRQVDPEPGGWSFRSPTETNGQWLEWRLDSKGQSTVFVINDHGQKIIKFDKKCNRSASEKAFFQYQVKRKYYKDVDLAKELKSNNSGLFYIWSPGMIYSSKHLLQFKKLCDELKIKFIPIIDWERGDEQILSAVKEFKLPENQLHLGSVELFMRGIHHHPTSFVFANARLSYHPVIGVKPDTELKREISWQLSELKK